MPPYKKRKAGDSKEDRNNDSKSLKTLEYEDLDLGADWREKCKSVSSKNGYALRKNILSDVKFIVGQSSTLFHGHRLILSLGSPVFEAMFFGPLAEKDNTIVIPDVDAVGFQNLLEFLYTDKVVLKSDTDAFKTYFAADKYCITGLKNYCEDYLCACELTPSGVWIFLENSFYLNSQAIRDRCSCLSKEDVRRALEHESFLDVNVKAIESLLSLNTLNISELDLLLKVITWAENKSKQENAESFTDILKPLLKYIRFGSLTAKEFIDLRKEKLKDMLSEKEALAILEHIIQPKVCALPEWCSKGKRNSFCPEGLLEKISYETSKCNYKKFLKNERKSEVLLNISTDSDDSSSDDTSFSSSSSSSS